MTEGEGRAHGVSRTSGHPNCQLGRRGTTLTDGKLEGGGDGFHLRLVEFEK